MKKYLITNIQEYMFSIKSNSDSCDKNLFFKEIVPKVGDFIYLSDNLLDEKILTFASIDSKYWKRNATYDNDLIILERNNQKYYLKRIYG